MRSFVSSYLLIGNNHRQIRARNQLSGEYFHTQIKGPHVSSEVDERKPMGCGSSLTSNSIHKQTTEKIRRLSTALLRFVIVMYKAMTFYLGRSERHSHAFAFDRNGLDGFTYHQEIIANCNAADDICLDLIICSLRTWEVALTLTLARIG